MSKDDKAGFARMWASAAGRKSEPSVIPMTRPQEDRAYVAFSVRNRVKRLEIRRATEPSRFPAYAYLLDMSYDRFKSSALTIVYTFMVVELEGQNLEPIMHAIQSGTCDRIIEFNTREHDKPASGQPIIESIEIITADEHITQSDQRKKRS